MLFVLLISPFSVLADEQKRNHSFFPHWEVGDWWVVECSGSNIFAPVPTWSLTSRIVYKVVARENIGHTECFVVERWFYPVSEKFNSSWVQNNQKGRIDVIYYFRTKDLVLMRKVDYYIARGRLESYKQDFSGRPLPYIDSSGEWLPIFPISPGKFSFRYIPGIPPKVEKILEGVKIREIPKEILKGIKMKVNKNFFIKHVF